MKRAKVLITRDKEQAKEFASYLSRYGIEPVFLPTIEIIEPGSWKECDEKIKRIREYTDLIFTSPNGVRFFMERFKKFHTLDKLRDKTFHAVGTKTGLTLERYGFNTSNMPDKFNAVELGRKIISESKPGRRKFLFPHGDLADDTVVRILNENGLEIDHVVVYRTVKPSLDNLLKDSIWRMMLDGEIKIVSFFSPSSVKNFLDIFPDFPDRKDVKVAVIGETTARSCYELGLRVDLIPGESTSEALAKLIFETIKG